MTVISKQNVPLVDLGAQHREIAEAVRTGFERVIADTSFVLGPEVATFEGEFANYCGSRNVVGVGNGTDALELALRGSGVGAGDEVIIPANTFVATAEAVVRSGARLRLVDCDENFLIDPAAVDSALNPRTRAIIGVHLYGQAAPMELLREIAGPDIVLVEDAAQAQGASRHGARAGTLGDVAGTSFYPGKNLGAYGDGGAVITDSDQIAEHVRALRNHGGVHRYEHLEIGTNSRLDALQAVVLSAKLGRLDAWNQARRAAAEHYDRLLADLPDVITPHIVEGNEHIFHLYVIRVPKRDAVVAALNADGIGAGVHYPKAVHRVRAFAGLGLPEGSFPVAEALSTQILSLPIYPGITTDQQDFVVSSLSRALSA